MASLDWSQCPAADASLARSVELGCFKGIHTPVASVFQDLEDGMTIDEAFEQFPGWQWSVRRRRRS